MDKKIDVLNKDKFNKRIDKKCDVHQFSPNPLIWD